MAKVSKLPSKEQILDFIQGCRERPSKREIARAFGIKGTEPRAELKRILARLVEEGDLQRAPGKRFGDGSAKLPPVGIMIINGLSEDGELIASPAGWKDKDNAPPKVIFAPPRKEDPSLGVGDRVLSKLRQLAKDDPFDYEAKPIRKLQGDARALGVVRFGRDGNARIEPVDKKQDKDFIVAQDELNGAEDGELVEVEVFGNPRAGLRKARVLERLGDMNAPRSISLIAIHEHGIPVDFPEATLQEAEAAGPVTDFKGRDDLRDLPLVTIDPEDARDHDDAIYAQPDPDNAGGHILYVAIADVAHYVRPGSALDRSARMRGNSCYFPDRVVPMLPDSLSGDLCSLHEGVERPCLYLRVVLAADGSKTSHSFGRAIMRSAASLSYENAQAMANDEDVTLENAAELKSQIIDPLYACYASLVEARERRQPLELNLPERRIVLSETGEVSSIRFRDRFDAHRLVEECMVLANVCAAETLEQKKRELLYRVHEPPNEERIEALRETLKSAGFGMAKGQRLTPGHLNRSLKDVANSEFAETINIAVLRAQTQAYYGSQNLGHFGLNLARYAHFTSPIRRYADLIVHRALISALSLGADPKTDGQTGEERAELEETAKHISQTERRAMTAERDSSDRYLAAYMSDRLGAEFDGIISGIARFGLFVKLDETGADGLVPMSALGDDYYRYDEKTSSLTGSRSRRKFRLGQRVRVRLEEAAPMTGGLRFSLMEDGKPLAAPMRDSRKGRRRSGSIKTRKRRKK